MVATGSSTASPHREDRWLLGLLALVAIALVASGIRPHDRFTWILEVLPVAIGVPILLATRRRFPLTPRQAVPVAGRGCARRGCARGRAESN